MADDWKWVFGIIAVVIIGMIFTGHLGGNIQFQGVVGVDCAAFKTNAVSGYNSFSVWVATDCNGDGAYESYKWNGGTSQTTQAPFGLSDTGDGKKYKCFNGASGYEVQIWTNIISTPYTYLVYSAQSGADLTCESAVCTDTCSSLGYTCGNWDICGTSIDCGICSAGNVCSSGGTCIVPGTCDFPGDGDDKISRTELGELITRWVGGN